MVRTKLRISSEDNENVENDLDPNSEMKYSTFTEKMVNNNKVNYKVRMMDTDSLRTGYKRY